jgi:phosphatidylserine synthase
MKLREIIVDSVLSWIVYFTLLFAFAGLVLFSIRGLVKDDFESIYFFIGTAITLSGFTMLSGIFEKKETKKKIEKKLFLLSILFLFSAFSFIVFIGLYSIFNDVKIITWQEQFWNIILVCTYYLGIIPFFSGFTYLIIVLIKHYNQIDSPEEIDKKARWQFWK